MDIPENVLYIIGSLKAAGFEACAVGGCVRDSLIGRTPKDWDICTSAKPEQTKAVFDGRRMLDTGIKHGTVAVIIGGETYEVTTFRIDGRYSNNRSPDSVEFTDDLTADLSRRDFTVNAMAWSPDKGLVDPFGGRDDLERGVVRAVGRPERRFTEDALRILRGLRFSVDLGLEVEPGTAAAMLSCRSLLDKISSERKRRELTAALMGGKIMKPFTRFREIAAQVIPELRPAFDMEQRTPHHCYDVYTHILAAVDNYDGDDPTVKTALLFHDIAKPLCRKTYMDVDHFKGHPAAGARIVAGILRRLKFDNDSVDKITDIVRFHDVRFKGGLPQMLKLMGLTEVVPCLFDVMRADIMAQSDYRREEKLALVEEGERFYRLALAERRCYRLCDLAVKGGDAVAMGLKGREIKAGLHYCLNGVMNGRVENTRKALIGYLLDFISKLR